MQAVNASIKCYCNLAALEKKLDPVGTAEDFDDAVVIEVPLPWKLDIYSKAGSLPQEIIDLLGLWLQRYKAGQGYRHRPLMVAPDRQYSKPGLRRVMYYERPEGAFARYEKREYHVPDEQLGALVWALYEAKDDLIRFDQYREPIHDSTRDILVCTHGTVDAACSKFGYPLYNKLRQNYADNHLRVWRVSHFGGHVFAPTLMDMPTGHYWAYVGDEQAQQIIEQSGDVTDLHGHYRGWAGLSTEFVQAVERALWQQCGWDWFNYNKSGQILAVDADEQTRKWAEVQINYTTIDGIEGICTAAVEVSHHVPIPHSTNSSEAYPYPQYKVTALKQKAAHHSH